MGKGSGNCTTRQPVLFVPKDTMILSLNDFHRQASRVSMILPNGERMSAWREAPACSPWEVYVHREDAAGKTFYWHGETLEESDSAAALIYGAEFSTIPALVNAVAALVGERIQYRIDDILYIAENPLVRSIMWRAESGWTIQYKQLNTGGSHSWDVQLNAFSNRQRAITAVNDHILNRPAHRPDIILPRSG